MNDDLLQNYNRELSFLRRLGAQFSRDHPKIAGRLNLGADGTSIDPHVERLIQSFALVSARTRQKLDDEFPEITEALLGVIYPHYLTPIPSMGIVEMGATPEQLSQPEGYLVKEGTRIDTEPINGEPCRFRTAYPLTLWPLEIETASLFRPPFTTTAPATKEANHAQSVLRIVVKFRGLAGTLQDLKLDRLRFYINAQPQHANLLYELIFNHTRELTLADAPRDPYHFQIDPEQALRQVGFSTGEGILPYPPRSFLGYRLLTEFFVFPQKFLFFDLELKGQFPGHLKDRLEIYLYLNKETKDLERYVEAGTFRLGCTPVVNLFEQPADPIPLTHTEYEYHVVPDERRKLAHEIYTIDSVTVTTESKEVVEFYPFFSVKHAADNRGDRYWQMSRRRAEHEEGEIDDGTEVYLSLVDLNMQPARGGGGKLHVQTLCMNRDLPRQLPFSTDQPQLKISEEASLVTRLKSLVPFTPTLRLGTKKGALWRLISHLNLNYLSLLNDPETDQADALREILKLYDYADSPRTNRMIEGLRKIKGERTVGRVGGTTFCRGVEVTIVFDPEAYSSNELFLFASVLERFLALYCTINSFTTLVAKTRDDEEGVIRRWPPRVGEKVLI